MSDRELGVEGSVFNKVESVKCVVCEKLWDAQSKGFFVFWGNVTRGQNGGIVGNNFNDDGRLKGVTVCCADQECLLDLLMEPKE